ncbi:hypothetical protein HAX54_024530, partial [Datura stramonium]|nr:hypothetical protein [Datura stramonium]
AIEGRHIKEDTCVLPNDIIFSILIKVYTASLLRFKCVSKSWNAMISNVKFAKDHRDQSKELGREKLLVQRSTGAHGLCSYDGLVLLKKPKAYKKFVLWNYHLGQHHIRVSIYETSRIQYPHASRVVL